jgi:hypothetical protein
MTDEKEQVIPKFEDEEEAKAWALFFAAAFNSSSVVTLTDARCLADQMLVRYRERRSV